MAIQVGDIGNVKRFEKFSLEIPIEINFGYIIESISLTAIGAKDAGITLSVSDDTPIISGQYTSSFNDNILFVNKGEATRLQIFEYDDSQPDGFAKDDNGENIPLDVPLPLSEEKFQEEKIKFPSLVQPTKIASIEQLLKNKDLIFAQQDPTQTINMQYQLAIEYSIYDQETGATETQDTLLIILDHDIETDTAVFQSILETYYTPNKVLSTANTINNFINTPPDDDDDDDETPDAPDAPDDVPVIIPDIPRAINYRIVANNYTIVEGNNVLLRCVGDDTTTTEVQKTFYAKALDGATAVGEPVIDGTFVFNPGSTLSNEILITTEIDLSPANQSYIVYLEDDGTNATSAIIVTLLDISVVTTYTSNAGSNPNAYSTMLDETGRALIDENGIVLTTINMNQTVAQLDAKLDAH